MPVMVIHIIGGAVVGGLIIYLVLSSTTGKEKGERNERINNLTNSLSRVRYDNQEMSQKLRQLDGEIRKHADLAILLPDLVKQIFSARSVSELSTYLTRAMNRLTGSEKVALFLADRKGGRLGLVSSRGLGTVLQPPLALNVGEGHVGFVAESGRLYSKAEFLDEPPLIRKQIEDGAIPEYIPDLAAPMMCQGVLFGVLCLNDIPSESGLVKERLRAVTAVGAAAMENIRLLERFSGASELDSDTGLPNEGRLVPILESELERVRRFESPLSLIDLEIPMGATANRFLAREAMMVAANYIKSTMRNIDTAVRMSRHRIILVLPGTDKAGIDMVVNRISREIPELSASEGEDKLAGVRIRSLNIDSTETLSPERIIDDINVLVYTDYEI